MAIGRQGLVQNYKLKLKHGVKGSIVVHSGANEGRYPTHVEETKGEDNIGFAHPFLQGSFLPVYKNMNFEFTIDDGGAIYVYPMTVTKVQKSAVPPIMWGEITDEPQRIQRRNFLRIASTWDIKIFPLDIERIRPMSMTWIPAQTLDISIKGTRFKLSEDAPKDLHFRSGDKIMISFELFEKDHFLLGGATRVVNEDGWEIGMAFDSVPSSVEKRLFEYIRQQEFKGRDI